MDHQVEHYWKYLQEYCYSCSSGTADNPKCKERRHQLATAWTCISMDLYQVGDDCPSCEERKRGGGGACVHIFFVC